MIITGIEAHYLLFAFDSYFGVDRNGRVGPCSDSVRDQLQSLRDRLMAAHEHPEEDEGDDEA